MTLHELRIKNAPCGPTFLHVGGYARPCMIVSGSYPEARIAFGGTSFTVFYETGSQYNAHWSNFYVRTSPLNGFSLNEIVNRGFARRHSPAMVLRELTRAVAQWL